MREPAQFQGWRDFFGDWHVGLNTGDDDSFAYVDS
jgi:hypothetical protein